VIRTVSSGSPSGVSRSVTIATASTAGKSIRSSARSRSYSFSAIRSRVSFNAYTTSLSFTKRTMCREMPWGSATR
jgi:hypothetical protein